MKWLLHTLTVTLLFLGAPALAQEATEAEGEPERKLSKKERGYALKSDIIEDRIELLVESMTEEDVDLTTLFENLEYFYDHPLNLNYASKEDLAESNGACQWWLQSAAGKPTACSI